MVQVKVFWSETRCDLEKDVNEFLSHCRVVKNVCYSVVPKQIGQVYGDVICQYHCMVVYEV